MAPSVSALTTDYDIQTARSGKSVLITAEERVKQRVAELLHGPIQTRLLLASLNIDKCLRMLPAAPEEARSLLREVRQDVERLREHDVREAGRLLHPSVLRVGVTAAIRALARRFADHFIVDVEEDEAFAVVDNIDGPGLPSPWRLGCYRIVEECLNNVYFHARAQHVSVRLYVREAKNEIPDGSPCELCVTVADDGEGFDPKVTVSGLGLDTIAVRAARLSGTVNVDSAIGRGTTVTARMLLP